MFETQYLIGDGMDTKVKGERADKLGRIIDKDDWFVSDEFFQYFEVLWNLHIVDRFASYLVTITVKFQDSVLEFGIQVVMHFP